MALEIIIRFVFSLQITYKDGCNPLSNRDLMKF